MPAEGDPQVVGARLSPIDRGRQARFDALLPAQLLAEQRALEVRHIPPRPGSQFALALMLVGRVFSLFPHVVSVPCCLRACAYVHIRWRPRSSASPSRPGPCRCSLRPAPCRFARARSNPLRPAPPLAGPLRDPLRLAAAPAHPLAPPHPNAHPPLPAPCRFSTRPAARRFSVWSASSSSSTQWDAAWRPSGRTSPSACSPMT